MHKNNRDEWERTVWIHEEKGRGLVELEKLARDLPCGRNGRKIIVSSHFLKFTKFWKMSKRSYKWMSSAGARTAIGFLRNPILWNIWKQMNQPIPSNRRPHCFFVLAFLCLKIWFKHVYEFYNLPLGVQNNFTRTCMCRHKSIHLCLLYAETEFEYYNAIRSNRRVNSVKVRRSWSSY